MDKAATEMILLGIKTLSQRALVAVSNSFTILSTASAFLLWYNILPAPNAYQLTGVGMYAAFILLLEVIRRRK